jgi:hypothetical protein
MFFDELLTIASVAYVLMYNSMFMVVCSMPGMKTY